MTARRRPTRSPLVAVAAATVAAANLIAVFPARAASRTRAAVALRSE